MLIDMFETAIIDPSQAFVFGCDYRVPMLHGLLEKNFINQLKMSPSYNEESFAREYMSLWTGASDESWFDYDRISKYRKIKNPEWHAKNRVGEKIFYLLSVDVGRLHDNSVVCVFRINTNEDRYRSTLVNIYMLGRDEKTKPLYVQAINIKQLIAQYNPKEVVIDTNGLGIGLADIMIQEQYDDEGNHWPAYGFFNDTMKDYFNIQPKDCQKILYGIKASGSLNSQIHSNAHTRLYNGSCAFLIKEQEAKVALLATKVGQSMSVEDRVKRLMPHEMTTKLFEEMANLRLKKTGTQDIVLEQINSRFPKDRYSAFAYGLWRLKELEEENFQKKKRRNSGTRQLIFFSGGE